MHLTIKAFGAEGMGYPAAERTGRTDVGTEKKNVFGGALRLTEDSIAQRRKEAQEKAWRLVKQAWESDGEADRMVESRRRHTQEMLAVKEEALAGVADVQEEKEVLRKLYEVDADASEQKDLELLEKAQNINSGVSSERLTEAERSRLEELCQKPLTEYQSRGLELNRQEIVWKKKMLGADRQIRDDAADIQSIGKERLKSAPVLKAKKEAEELLDAANQDIIGMLVQESKAYIDETSEELKEEAEKSAEKKEAREELLEEQKIKRAMQEAVLADSREAAQKAKALEESRDAPVLAVSEILNLARGETAAEEIGQSLEELKNSMKLLEADLKGMKVDEEV